MNGKLVYIVIWELVVIYFFFSFQIDVQGGVYMVTAKPDYAWFPAGAKLPVIVTHIHISLIFQEFLKPRQP